eukprot:scaffold151922_cov55-Cyclotella_meneghiniana.AAC.1
MLMILTPSLAPELRRSAAARDDPSKRFGPTLFCFQQSYLCAKKILAKSITDSINRVLGLIGWSRAWTAKKNPTPPRDMGLSILRTQWTDHHTPQNPTPEDNGQEKESGNGQGLSNASVLQPHIVSVILVATVEKRKRSHAKKKEGPGEGPRDAKRSKDEVYYR